MDSRQSSGTARLSADARSFHEQHHCFRSRGRFWTELFWFAGTTLAVDMGVSLRF
jgi:hypothetical protein